MLFLFYCVKKCKTIWFCRWKIGRKAGWTNKFCRLLFSVRQSLHLSLFTGQTDYLFSKLFLDILFLKSFLSLPHYFYICFVKFQNYFYHGIMLLTRASKIVILMIKDLSLIELPFSFYENRFLTNSWASKTSFVSLRNFRNGDEISKFARWILLHSY